jgi:hypothetical protein
MDETKAPQAPGSEGIEDVDRYDELEPKFHQVIQDLADDESLFQFRSEYEKMFQELTTAHERNVLLMNECRKLNNSIVSNTSKVSSIVSLSQSDQLTITGLSNEFEKAWNLVELYEWKGVHN